MLSIPGFFFVLGQREARMTLRLGVQFDITRMELKYFFCRRRGLAITYDVLCP